MKINIKMTNQLKDILRIATAPAGGCDGRTPGTGIVANSIKGYYSSSRVREDDEDTKSIL